MQASTPPIRDTTMCVIAMPNVVLPWLYALNREKWNK